MASDDRTDVQHLVESTINLTYSLAYDQRGIHRVARVNDDKIHELWHDVLELARQHRWRNVPIEPKPDLHAELEIPISADELILYYSYDHLYAQLTSLCDYLQTQLRSHDRSDDDVAAASRATESDSVAGGRPDSGGTKKGRGGRPRLSDEESVRRLDIVEKWRRAKAGGRCQKEFCEDNNVSLLSLRRWIDWEGKRTMRSGSE